MKTSRIICSIMLLLLGVALVGCSHKNAPDQELIEGKGKDFTTLSRSKAVDVVAEPYVGVKAVPIRADEASQAELNTRVMLRKRGTLSDIDTMKLVGLSRNTYYKYKKELKQGN